MSVRDPEELEAAGGRSGGEISPQARPGPVHLTVSNLERSLEFYLEAVGLELLGHSAGEASLGAGGGELVHLVELPGAAPDLGHTGLYHVALLLPERQDLARWLAHAARDRVPLTGLSDHFVSEALYLSDPDGHGLEIYWDRPRELWEGRVAARMTTIPLDVDSLLADLPEGDGGRPPGLPPGTVVGHVHLKVAGIAETVAFYRDVLGFGLMAALGPQAAFLSAGGYHHHIGANTWESAGAGPPPEGTAALRHATLVLPGDDERDRLLGRVAAAGRPARDGAAGPLIEDPSGNRWLLAVGGGRGR